MQYLVTADIRYISGPLEGLTIPAGYSVTMPDVRHATRVAAHLQRVQRDGDFIRAVGTGHKYQVIGGIHSAPLMPIV